MLHSNPSLQTDVSTLKPPTRRGTATQSTGHCERSEAIQQQAQYLHRAGLLRYARNDQWITELLCNTRNNEQFTLLFITEAKPL